jgi:hypothetical protein
MLFWIPRLGGHSFERSGNQENMWGLQCSAASHTWRPSAGEISLIGMLKDFFGWAMAGPLAGPAIVAKGGRIAA